MKFIVLGFTCCILTHGFSCYASNESNRKAAGEAIAVTSIPTDTVYVGDTLKIIDTVTIFFDEPEKIRFFANITLLSGIPFSKYQSTDYPEINQEITNIPCYGIGGAACLRYKKLIFEPGIQLLILREKLQHKPTNLFIETNEYTRLDTIDIWFQIVGTDTIIGYETELRTYTRTDSTYLNTPYINTYPYLEIPLIIGYMTNADKFNFFIKGGIVTSLTLKSKANNYHPDASHNLSKTQKEMYVSPLISFCAEGGVKYPINKQTDFMISAVFRRSGHSMFESSFPHVKKIMYIGINMSLSFSLQ